jgi:hypothetical protein
MGVCIVKEWKTHRCVIIVLQACFLGLGRTGQQPVMPVLEVGTEGML